MVRSPTWCALACAAGMAVFPCGLQGQAAPTASQRAHIKVYGAVSYVQPDFNGSANGMGFTLGGNFDGIRLLPYLDLGLDLRGATAHSDVISESFLAGGPRISYNAFRLQPYAEYMFGAGRGIFNKSTDPIYMRDYTAIRSYGGGLDYRLTTNFSLRADVQRQRWRFTQVVPYFHPVQVSIGVSYQVHLRSRTGPRF